MEKLKEECGLFGGVCNSGNIAPIIKNGLFMLQHRGQENAGIACGSDSYTLHKDVGLVDVVLSDKIVHKLNGSFGVGHVRYSTQGKSEKDYAQPFKTTFKGEDIVIAHNGPLPLMLLFQ